MLSCKRADRSIIDVTSAALGNYSVICERGAELLFVDNETNPVRARGVRAVVGRERPYFKDGINNYLVLADDLGGQPEARRNQGGRALPPAHPGGGVAVGAAAPSPAQGRNGDGAGARSDRQALLAADFTSTLAARRREADEFYAAIIPQVAVGG